MGSTPINSSMTEKQKKFCIEYLKDLNATQAAIRTGYSEKTAYSIGNENLSKPEIREFIDKELTRAMNAGRKELEQRILSELQTLAFDPMTDEDSKLRYNDKIKSLELLGKYTAMFTDKVEHTVNSDVIEALRSKYENK